MEAVFLAFHRTIDSTQLADIIREHGYSNVWANPGYVGVRHGTSLWTWQELRQDAGDWNDFLDDDALVEEILKREICCIYMIEHRVVTTPALLTLVQAVLRAFDAWMFGDDGRFYDADNVLTYLDVIKNPC